MAKLEITKRIRFPLYRGFQPQINLPPEGGSRAVQCTTGMLPQTDMGSEQAGIMKLLPSGVPVDLLHLRSGYFFFEGRFLIS
jgi:hypothetical protein